MSNLKIGWIGLGKMGIPMARNLLENNFQVMVYNRTRAKCQELVEAGATVADSIAQLSQSVDVVISMIPDDPILKGISLGPDGVVENLGQGAIFIDMSTVSPQASEEVAKVAQNRGISYLRAPVSGSTVVATAGLLTIICSGPRDAYETCRSAFEAMGKTLFHVGNAEEARYLKLAINMMVGTTAAMMSEALTFGKRGGMDWKQMLDIIDSSAVASPLIKYKIEALKERDFSPAFTASQMGKDFDLALDTAREKDLPMPLTSQVRQNWSAMKARGTGELDFFAYVTLLEQLAGLESSPASQSQ